MHANVEVVCGGDGLFFYQNDYMYGLLGCVRLFRDGNVNWGRIVTLLCFGYRMAVTVIQRGIRGFFSQIVGFVVRFVCSERIARWIADQGGWVNRCLDFYALQL